MMLLEHSRAPVAEWEAPLVAASTPGFDYLLVQSCWPWTPYRPCVCRVLFGWNPERQETRQDRPGSVTRAGEKERIDVPPPLLKDTCTDAPRRTKHTHPHERAPPLGKYQDTHHLAKTRTVRQKHAPGHHPEHHVTLSETV